MIIERALIDECGGQDALATAVAELAEAWERHAFTVGVAAPAAPPLVEAIWRAGGMEAVEIVEPPPFDPPPRPPSARAIPALAFRRRFTGDERAAITLAASRGLERGDATLQLWIDDLNATDGVDLDHAEVIEVVTALVQAGLLDAERVAAILA